MNPAEAWQRLQLAPSAALGTVDPDRGIHLVPVVFTIVERRIAIAVDAKPKRTRKLRRLANIERDPRVTMLADHYESDWDRLWWVRVDGLASVEAGVSTDLEDRHRRLHPQVGDQQLGPWIVIDVEGITGWAADPGGS